MTIRGWICWAAGTALGVVGVLAGSGGARAQGGAWVAQPIRAVRPPLLKNGRQPAHPIDAFILKKLEENGLEPALPAGRVELARRVALDLTGLPPTEGQLREYLATPAAGAYERLVDQLLASPRYGERWGRHWLDVVRFAESQGFERDKIRDHSWRYRDYVIDALNRDLPYDQFIREQIAGDVLPNADARTISATGFLVAGPFDEVGNAQSSNVMRARVREEELEDVVSVVGQTFLGLTVNCARCHDHKYDPIPQRDYYRIQAALAGVRHGDRTLVPPAVQQARAAERGRWEQRVREVDARLSAIREPVRQRLVRERNPGARTAAGPQPLVRWGFESDGSALEGGLKLEGGARIRGGRLELNGRDASARTADLPAALGARTLEAWVNLADLEQRGGGVLVVEDAAGVVFDGIVFGERQPRVWMSGSDGFRRTVNVGGPAETDAVGLVHVAVTYAENGLVTLYRNGLPYGNPYRSPSPLVTYRPEAAHIRLGLRHGAAGAPGSNAWLSGSIDEARVYGRALSADDVLKSFQGGPISVPTGEIDRSLAPADRERVALLARERDALVNRIDGLNVPELAYAANPTQPGPIHILKRGDPEQSGEAVAPGGLACIPGVESDFKLDEKSTDAERRLALARWLTDPKNPVPDRVMVNRVWHYHFGKGLVSTPSDFGLNGDRPSHPELLDWLAARFASEGRSLKRLHRLIVTSATYRQSGRMSARAARVDADNRLLSCNPPRRLDAEAIRDVMLEASGQLNLTPGGPGFRPFKVVVANTHFYTYEDRTEPEYQRRTVYRTVVNSGGVPFLDAFDCPDPSVKTPRRGSTITPLQALVLANSSFTLRQSRLLAERCGREAGADPLRQIEQAYRLTLQRAPLPRERARAQGFVAANGLPALCRALFNSSEFLYQP